MSRYKYIPMSYDDYMGKYINTLKTGELLVDLNNHDIYVTEEGFNIPIPATKQLRDKIINYLENDLEGIKIRQQVIPGKINNLFSIKQAIEEQQQNIFDRTKNLLDDSRSLDRQYTFLNKVNENNVNQLGDLKVEIDSKVNERVQQKRKIYQDNLKEIRKNGIFGRGGIERIHQIGFDHCGHQR